MADHRSEPMTGFEARLADRLVRHAAIAVAPPDAAAVARDAAATGRRRSAWWRAKPGRGGSWSLTPARAAAWMLIALATLLAATLVAGAVTRRDPIGGRPLLLATETGLFLADGDGRGAAPLRDDGSFISPRWSPSGDHIAVLHGPPIPGQAGAANGKPRTPVPFTLAATEVDVLRGDGTTEFIIPGAASGFAWSAPGADGHSLLAVGLLDGTIVVVGPDGHAIATVVRDLPDAGVPPEPPLRAQDIAWIGPRALVAGSTRGLLLVDVDRPSATVVVSPSGPDRVNAVAVSPNGRLVAFVVAPCRIRCQGSVHLLAHDEAADRFTSATTDSVVAQTVEASAALSFDATSSSLLAWPHVLSLAGPTPSWHRAPSSSAIENHDIVAAWTRVLGDESGRMSVLNTYPAFNDRHFDAWIVAPDGRSTRVAVRSLGFDLRPSAGPAAP